MLLLRGRVRAAYIYGILKKKFKVKRQKLKIKKYNLRTGWLKVNREGRKWPQRKHAERFSREKKAKPPLGDVAGNVKP